LKTGYLPSDQAKTENRTGKITKTVHFIGVVRLESKKEKFEAISVRKRTLKDQQKEKKKLGGQTTELCMISFFGRQNRFATAPQLAVFL